MVRSNGSRRDCFSTQMVDAFKSEQLKNLCLDSKKHHALVDFLASLPAISTKAATEANIKHGFYEAGILDRESGGYPVLKKILASCRISISKEIYDKIISNFKYLFKIVAKFGRIPEEVFDELGFPDDVDASGKVVKRDAGISREIVQRSKWLTHFYQVNL